MRLLKNVKSKWSSLLGVTARFVDEVDVMELSRLPRIVGMVEAISGVKAGGSHGIEGEYVSCG